MFVFFGSEARGVLVPWPGIEPVYPALEGKVLTTGPPGKSPFTFWCVDIEKRKRKTVLLRSCFEAHPLEFLSYHIMRDPMRSYVQMSQQLIQNFHIQVNLIM